MNRLARWSLIPLTALALAGCGATEQSTEAVATDTPAAPLVLSDVALEPLLIAPGDLPIGLTGAQVLDSAPKMFDNMPPAEQVITQQFADGSEQVGGISVFLYESEDEITKGYNLVADGFGDTAQAIDGIGEQALGTVPTDQDKALGLIFIDLLFRRCHAVTHIRMSGADIDLTKVSSYAKRLDKRLQESVCE